MVFWRKLKTLLSLPPVDWGLVLLIFLMLGLVRLMVLILPFRFYANVIGKRAPLNVEPSFISSDQVICARRLGRLVRAVAKITPWDSLCLPQALVAAVLLRVFRIPHATFFGLRKPEAGVDLLLAHAWVMANECAITGGQGHDRYTTVAVYVSQ